MPETTFWGVKGEFGPFTRQADGWPNAGEVIRYYRKRLEMSAETLAQKYGEATDTHITARWILKMEQHNRVPTDIVRRRVLANLLHIPPMLLGLASLEAVTYRSATTFQPPTVLASTSVDLERYGHDAHVYWQLHYAQTAQNTLNDLQTHIHHLRPLQQTAQGNLKRRVNELMNSYYRLAATIQRDHGNFEQAALFAREAVRFAKDMGTDPYASHLVAASQYTRGVAFLAWGAFGHQANQGNVSLQPEKITAALADFERALKYASPQLKGIIYSEMARAKALVTTSPMDTTIALKLLEQAERFVDVDGSDDFYLQILLNGDFKGLDKRRLILGRAKTFSALKRPTKVLEELATLENLREGPGHTRRRAWTHILSAQASFRLGDYALATEETIQAFHDCQEVHSLTHLARVKELHTMLSNSPSQRAPEVKWLGRRLNDIFPQTHRSIFDDTTIKGI